MKGLLIGFSYFIFGLSVLFTTMLLLPVFLTVIYDKSLEVVARKIP